MNKLVKSAVQLSNRNISGRIFTFRNCSTSDCTPSTVKDAPGLSKNVVDVPSGEVGYPNASKEAVYKNPEYFCYNNTSYFEAEVEMLQYRLPQPSNKPKK